jgi:Mn2+/Fe2+ NRAMP family transporter
VPRSATFLRRLLWFAGPGFLVAVGYMDPGNWATDLAGGSRYEYGLLSVIMLSNLMAILPRGLRVKLGVAIVPAIAVTVVAGESATANLLVLSQVILSVQLGFAVVPLVMFTSDRSKMGEFVNPRWLRGVAWAVAALIAIMNAWLLVQTVYPHSG